MKMIFCLVMLFGANGVAAVGTVNGRVYTGLVSPQISPLGAIVDVDTGEVLYVRSLISVLAPSQLEKDCLYQFSFTVDDSVPFKAIRLVPPTHVISCGHDFPGDK